MNRKTFLWVVALAIVSISGILFVQLFWMNKAFDLSNKQFEHNVNMALLNVTNRLCEINHQELTPDPIEQLSANYFIVNLNDRIDPNVLEVILTNEFQQRELTLNFEYGIFDCSSKEMVYGRNIDLSQTEKPVTFKFPKLKKDAYYFGVYFPSKPADLSGEMGIWWFSSSVLVVVVLFFGYALFAIFRQRQLSEIQTDFINNMTHEFKTPIATITIASDVLASKDINTQPDRITQYASIIKKEISRLQTQVDRVLQMGTSNKNSLSLSLKPLDINKIIDQVISSSNIALSTKDGSITFDAKQELPNIQADLLHITNVIHNLVDNAIKYNHSTPRINITTEISKKGVIIIIKDNGQGIGKKELRMIFNKFYRVPTGNIHDVKGFGLGLYYVKNVINTHRGTISVNSSSSGTTFTIELPYQP